MVGEKFKFMVLRLLKKTFVSQKIESFHFCSCRQAKISPRFLSLPLKQKKITHSSLTAFSEDIYFPQQQGGRGLWSCKSFQNHTYEGGGHKF